MIRFHLPTKIVFLVLGLMILAAAIFIVVEYPKLKSSAPVSQNESGKCSPDLAACQNNPKLCLDINANAVCN